MKMAIMQPYIFPYIGYFQLIEAVDVFVFYDDVNFINRGWINRNRILLNGKDHLFTIPLSKASQNKLIRMVETAIDEKYVSRLEATLHQAYKKAPFYHDVMHLIQKIFSITASDIALLAANSVRHVCDYIGLQRQFLFSSAQFPDSTDLKKEHRLISICKTAGADHYINAWGGTELYNKEVFHKQGILLSFLKSKEVAYDQGIPGFVPWLSVIDVLMFNSPEDTLKLINAYELL